MHRRRRTHCQGDFVLVMWLYSPLTSDVFDDLLSTPAESESRSPIHHLNYSEIKGQQIFVVPLLLCESV